MAGMFCSLQEAAQRLGKTEDELKDLIKQGTLREFRDGSSLLLKLDELEALAAEEGIELAPPAVTPPPEEPALEIAEAEVPELEMPEDQVPDLDALEPEIPELEALESDEATVELSDLDAETAELGAPELEAADMETPDLASLEPDEEVPAAEADEPQFAIEEPLTDEAPPAEKPKEKKKRKKKEKPPRKPKPKAKPKPRAAGKVLKGTTQPRLSFGEWLFRGLQDDDPVAVIVLVLILGIIIAAVVAAAVFGYAMLK